MVFTPVMSTRNGHIRSVLALVVTVPLIFVGALAVAAPGSDGATEASLPGASQLASPVSDAASPSTQEARSSRSSKAKKANVAPKAKRTKSSRAASTGSRRGFELLPASGTGYYHYAGGDDPTSDVWGHPSTIQCVEEVSRKWADRYPRRPRIGVGDISLKNGGTFRPHRSHRNGVDVDIRPMKARGEGPVSVGQPSYSRKHTKDMIELFIETCNVKRVYFNDMTLARKMDKVSTHPGHHNHVHFTLHAPKGRALASSGRHGSPSPAYK